MMTDEQVQVHDDWLPADQRQQLIDTLAWVPVHFLNRRDRDPDTHALDLHWFYPFAVSEEADRGDVEQQVLDLEAPLDSVAQCWARIKSLVGRPLRLYECMLSANTFGTEGGVHHDIRQPQARPRHLTALVYCNREWSVDWGGETLVFDAQGEITAGVRPRPGRLMLLFGDPSHVGRSVTRICPSDRRVLVFKAWVG